MFFAANRTGARHYPADRTILAFIVMAWRQDRVAALSAPYAAWVGFACEYYGAIFALNKGGRIISDDERYLNGGCAAAREQA